ncbi:GbsR/MarR family transcriptional regulator [Marinigracilibium pacificum]|uniref:MarR family transcriptional regulator n=1 Tax=Marinigracilibium pacificum TaxID=2729599 RepID=A0A848IZ69_9BACT|nr:MarR family transcriptional regulator [Marinigracilibium pacificum]NMM47590.1 MarR family transcriptional regulator [Marinigracilibium pacificum]
MEDKKIILTEQQKEVLEMFGVFLEKKGWQPALARVLGVLALNDEGELTFDQIRDVLNLSKSATSSALNNLINNGKVEYITKTGDRKRYFRIKPIMVHDMILEEIDTRKELTRVLKEVYDQKSNKEGVFCHNLKTAIEFFEFMNDKITKAHAEWKLKNS